MTGLAARYVVAAARYRRIAGCLFDAVLCGEVALVDVAAELRQANAGARVWQDVANLRRWRGGEPVSGTAVAWRSLYASAMVTIRRAGQGERPGVGVGDKAWQIDGGDRVTVKVTETARKRGRTGEIRRVLGELVTSR